MMIKDRGQGLGRSMCQELQPLAVLLARWPAGPRPIWSAPSPAALSTSAIAPQLDLVIVLA
jgi:hypothetical protein